MQQSSCSDYSNMCSNVIYQSVDVGLPIILTPDVDVGKIKIKCTGEPRVELRQFECENGRWELIVTQTVAYKIPIEYSIDSNTGDVTVECEKNTTCI